MPGAGVDVARRVPGGGGGASAGRGDAAAGGAPGPHSRPRVRPGKREFPGSRSVGGFDGVGDSIPGSIAIPRDVPPAAGGGNVAGTPLLHFVYLRPPLGQYARRTGPRPYTAAASRSGCCGRISAGVSLDVAVVAERTGNGTTTSFVHGGGEPRGASGDAAEAGARRSPRSSAGSGSPPGGGSGGDDGGDAAPTTTG